TRRALRHAGWTPPAGVGGGHEDGGGVARPDGSGRPGTGYRNPYVWIPRTRDIWFPLYAPVYAPGAGRNRGDLRTVLVPPPDQDFLSLLAALHAPSLPLAPSERRPAAVMGRQIAAGIG